MYLAGNPIELRQSVIKRHLGVKVKYILDSIAKSSGGRYIYPEDGEITKVENGCVEFDYSQELIPITDIAEMIYHD